MTDPRTRLQPGSLLSRQALGVSEGDPRLLRRLQALDSALSCRNPSLLEVTHLHCSDPHALTSELLRWWPFQLPWGRSCPRGLAASG